MAVSCSHSVKTVRSETRSKTVKLKARDHYLKGILLQQQARYNEALVEFYQALQYDSASAAIHNSIAENHMKLTHYESAEILLRKSLNYQPGNEEALLLLAECHLRLGRDDQAIAVFKEILQKNPYDDEARQYLLILYEKNGDDLGIAEQNESMIKLYGKDVHLQERLANIYLKQKKYDKALYYLNELLAGDSTASQIYYLMGQVKDKQNLSEDAAVLYHKALHFDPLFQGALDKLTRWYRSKGDWQKVIELYQPVLKADSSSRPARVLIAESYYYLEEFDQAREFLLPLVTIKTPQMNIVELMGRIEFEAKNLQKAKEYFRFIVEKETDNKFAYLFLAFTLSDMDSLIQAEATYKNALEKFPDDVALWSFYGLNLQRQEKYGQSIDAFQKALALDSLNSNALSNLPVVYESLNMYSKSDSVYEVGIKRLPDNDLLLNNYSYSLSERNLRMPEALEMSKKAITAKPDNAAYLDTIGWIYFKLGNLTEAEKYIKKSVEIREDSPVVLEHLGDVYSAMGNMSMAKTHWQKSLNLDQENQQLLRKMEMIK